MVLLQRTIFDRLRQYAATRPEKLAEGVMYRREEVER